MYAQENFDTYINKLFLNAYTGNPDSSIFKFLSDYAPALLHPPKTTGTWTAYPIENKDWSEPIPMTHSIYFNKHPFINAEAIQVEFKLYTELYNNEFHKNLVQIKDIQITFEFLKLDEAIKLFDKLRSDLIGIGQEHVYYNDKFKRYSEVYSNQEINTVPCGIKICLITERSIYGLYHLIIN